MFQDRTEDDFVIVQDVDVTQDDWTLWRNSLAQMFIAMREGSRLPPRFQNKTRFALGCVNSRSSRNLICFILSKCDSPSLSPHSNFTLIRNDGDGDLVEREVGSNDILDGVIFPADISDLRGDLDLARAFQMIEAMVAAPNNRTPNVVILTKSSDGGGADLSAALELIR